MARINFTEWLPDQPGVIGALTNATNVYPKQVGYGSFQDAADVSNSASQDLESIFVSKSIGGTTKVFAGGSTLLFLLNSTNLDMDNVSGTTYVAGSIWKFAQFGDSVYAVNGANTLQRYELATSTTFADVTGAPKPKFLTVVRDFLVTANQDSNKNRVQWSGINDPTTWTSSAVTQADFQDLPEGREIMNIVGGEYGLIFLETAIVRMSYVGAPLVFQFDTISKNLGCYESSSVIAYQGVSFFLADDGFYQTNGQTVENIGSEKVNRFFFDNLNDAVVEEMSSSIDPTRNLVVWAWASQDSQTADRLLIYNYAVKKWTLVEVSINRVGTISTPGITLEGIDTFSSNLDELSISLDSRFWRGGKLSLGGISGRKLISFTGNTKQARIDTSDLETENAKTMISLAKPIVNKGSASVAVASRNLLNEDVTFGSYTDADSENRVGIRSVGRYHRVSVKPSGNWETAIGVDVDVKTLGER